MDIKETAFRKAALMLSAIGAEFAIIYEGKEHTSGSLNYALNSKNGQTYGNLELAQAKRRLASPRQSLAHTGYSEALKLLGAGEAWAYTCTTKEEAKRLQAAVTGTAVKLYGGGNYLTTVKDGKVLEILRVV